MSLWLHFKPIVFSRELLEEPDTIKGNVNHPGHANTLGTLDSSISFTWETSVSFPVAYLQSLFMAASQSLWQQRARERVIIWVYERG